MVRRFVAPLISMLVFVCGLALTNVVASHIDAQADELARLQFSHAAERLEGDVVRRLTLPLYGLKGARAAVLADGTVAGLNDLGDEEGLRRRTVLASFVRERDLDHEFPGVRGIGLIERVERADQSAFEQRLRADDWSFRVRAHSLLARDLYVISAIEPLARNREAWGFDIGSESRRRDAIEVAIDSGAALTAPIALMQDREKGEGLLLMIPIFTPGAPLTGPSERRAALLGLVYAPTISRELFDGVEQAADRTLDLDVWDVTNGAALLFDSDDHVRKGTPLRDARFASHHVVSFAGRSLRVDVYSLPGFERLVAPERTAFHWGFGVLLSLVCAALAWALATSRTRALALADQMTAELRSATERAERSHREIESLYGALDANFIVSVTDGAGTIVSANDAMCQLTGYRLEELVGANHRIVNSGTHPPAFWREMWKQVASGQAWRGEICNRRGDGSLYWVDTVIAPLPGGTARSRRYVSIRTDITSRKANEAELARQTELARTFAKHAEEASQAKSSFLATMSHEIRTPMNGVLGMTELLLGMQLTPEQEEVARTVYRSADALLVLLNDLLDFSKIEAGKLEYESLAFDVRQVACDTVELFKARADEKGLELLLNIESEVSAELMGDPTRVRQVLLNLVGNALKFTETGHVQLSVRQHDDTLLLEVEDTGPGIPEERQHILFQPFTQADVSTSRKHGGTGLGLAISRRLARGMGGELEMHSTVGVGTRFTVRLPLGAVKRAAPEPQRLTGVRVLVVERYKPQRRLLAAQLERAGAHVETEAEQSAALRRLSAEKFQVVLWDDRLAPEALPAGTHLVQQRTRTRRVGAVTVSRPASREALLDAVRSALSGGARPALTVTRAPAVAQMQLRVLVADDNAVNLRVARGMLERLGCEVTTVDDGARAVSAFAARPWDCVFMDCQMPEMDGYEATAHIRANEHGTRTPIIAMTANASADDHQRCLAAGMDDFLAKPCRLDDFAKILERVARREKAA